MTKTLASAHHTPFAMMCACSSTKFTVRVTGVLYIYYVISCSYCWQRTIADNTFVCLHTDFMLCSFRALQTGIEATKALRELGYPNMIIGLTGNSIEGELQDFSLVGADLVLTKPLRPKALDLLLDHFRTQGVQSQYVSATSATVCKSVALKSVSCSHSQNICVNVLMTHNIFSHCIVRTSIFSESPGYHAILT